jgi:hypothetical protein
MADMRTIRATMGVPPFQPANGNGNGHLEEDELTRAMRQRRALLGTRLLDDTTSQVAAQAQLDARKLDLEARKLELEEAQAEARLQSIRSELAASRRQPQDDGPGILGAVVQLLMEDRQAQREANEAAQQRQGELWKQMLEMATRPAHHQPAAPLPSLAERIAEVKTVIGAVRDLQPPPPPSTGQLTAREMIDLEEARARLEHDRTRLSVETQLELRRLEADETRATAEQQLRQAVMQSEKERNDRLAQLLEQAAPAVVNVISGALTGNASANGQQQQGVVVTCPNPECGKQLTVPAGTTSGVCPHCRQMLVLHEPGEAQPAEAPMQG